MKNIIKLLTIVSFLAIVANGQAIILFQEDFNSYASGSIIDGVAVPYNVFGNEQSGSVILGNNVDNHVQIIVTGTDEATTPGVFAFGLIQISLLTPIDLSNNPGSITFQFDVTSNFLSVFPDVLTPQIVDVGGNSFRLPDISLLDLPTGDLFTTLSVAISALDTVGDSGVAPDLTDIRQFNLLFLETNTDIIGEGLVLIDNIIISSPDGPGAIPEPATLFLLGSAIAGLLRLRKRS